jgi:uncharacterized protein (TIRG00374 family)
MKSWVKSVLKAATSAALIAYLVRSVDLGEVWLVVKAADWTVLSFAFCMFYVGYAITAARWQTLLRALGNTSDYWFLFRSFMVAVFFNNFLPSTIGGDAMRMYDSWRSGSTRSQAVAAVAMDRFMGLTALLVFAVFALIFGNYSDFYDSGVVLIVTVMAFVAVMLLFLVMFLPRSFAGRLEGLASMLPAQLTKVSDAIIRSLRAFRNQRPGLVLALFLSFLLQANVVLYHWIVANALGLSVSLMAFFLIVPIAIVVMMIPVSINGIGVREGLFVLLLSMHGVPQAEGLAYAWVIYALLLLQGLIGGVVFAFRRDAGSSNMEIAANQSSREHGT